jgi:hypothetical protein
VIDPLISVRHVKALPGFRLRLRFSDGAEGVFDCTNELWGEVFEPLKDPKYFAKVFLDHGAPSWPNGADLDPAALRSDIKPAPASRRTAARKLRSGKSAAVREAQANYLRKKAN